MTTKRIVVGISGASGATYGIRVLELLRETPYETHLVLSEAAAETIALETGRRAAEVAELADAAHDIRDIGAPPASGSFLCEAMIVAPCSIRSLSAIAHSSCGNLLQRSADVTLKEGRRLVLLVRETPLHKGHIRLMGLAADLGALILPPVPAFYHAPQSVRDVVDQTVGKVFDQLGIEHDLFRRWRGRPDEPARPIASLAQGGRPACTRHDADRP